MKKFILFAFVLVFSGCTSSPLKKEDISKPEITNAILKEIEFLEDDLTLYFQENIVKFPDSKEFPSIVEVLSGYDIIFDKKNHQLIEFKNPTNIVLIPEVELDAIFKDGCEPGWQQFFDTYSDTKILFTMSNIALNTNNNKVAVYLAIHSSCMLGFGNVFFLEKELSDWIVTSTEYVWGGY